jgi:hypothetical protein
MITHAALTQTALQEIEIDSTMTRLSAAPIPT